MPKVILNTPARDLALKNFEGETIRLSGFFGQANILLVFSCSFV